MKISQDHETIAYPIEMLNERRRRPPEHGQCRPGSARSRSGLRARPATVLMRTPGHDEELVRGFLFSEGIITRADGRPLNAPSRGPAGPARRQRDRRPVRRHDAASGARSDVLQQLRAAASCGKRSIDSLEVKAARLESLDPGSARGADGSLPDRLRAAQPTFALTGGVHASGLFTPDGELVAVREDVGRHNALDKLIGWAVARELGAAR